jgi:ABC-type sugar transport system substrate-binding protein
MKKKFIILFTLLLITSVSFANINVTFINPGKSDETFWLMVSEFMQASANDLEINLEIKYAERNFLGAVTIMKEIVARVNKPDYVVIVNEKLIAPRLLEISEEAGIKTFMILNGLTSEQIKSEGKPREKHKKWIGSLIPDNEKAGYMIADNLIKEAHNILDKKVINMIAIAGNRVTPASVQRVEGLGRAIQENESINLLQILYAEWNEEEAYIMTNGMFNRYRFIDLIWAINDPTAFGAMRAVREERKELGKEVIVAGLNWSKEAIERIKTGEMLCSIGGHFMVGGWSLVMIKDYHENLDFINKDSQGEHQINIFGIIDKSNVARYCTYFQNENWNKIDFRTFSKYYNNKIDEYDFSLDKILSHLENQNSN